MRGPRSLRTIVSLLMVLTLNLGLLGAPASVVAANPSADLDQCANGSFSNQSDCTGRASSWVNGNLGASKAHYLEGQSIPYRMLFGNLTNGATYQVTIEWDTTKGGKHAIDYLTTYDRDVASDPRLGVRPALSATTSTYPIPADSYISGAGVSQSAGDFTLFGGTITGVSGYTYSGSTSADSSNRITVTFTAGARNPVLAWGGHISSRRDWGRRNSAVAISGSPYHMRLIDLNGQGGNQDRSLAADAVLFPGAITVIKTVDAALDGDATFAFTASPAPLHAFSLTTVDGSAATTFDMTSFTRYTIAESAKTGWHLADLSCVVDMETENGGSANVSGSSVSLNLREGEEWTCTFANERAYGDLEISKDLTWDTEAGDFAGPFDISYDCTSGTGDWPTTDVTSGTVSLEAGASATIAHLPAGARCVVAEEALPTAPERYHWDTVTYPAYTPASATVTIPDGDVASVLVTNGLIRNVGGLVISKTLTGGPASFDGTFGIHYDCTAGTGGATGSVTSGDVELSAGSSVTIPNLTSGTICTVVETSSGTSPAGYDWSTVTYAPASGTVEIPDDSTATSITVTVQNHLVPNSQITPTNESCSTFVAGTAMTLPEIQFAAKAGSITQVNPGVFYYWAIVHGDTVTVTQGSDLPYGFFPIAAGSGIYDMGCGRVGTATTGARDATFTGLGADSTHIVGIKYSANAIVGTTGVNGTNRFTAWFAASPATYQEIALNRKNASAMLAATTVSGSTTVAASSDAAIPAHGKALAKAKPTTR